MTFCIGLIYWFCYIEEEGVHFSFMCIAFLRFHLLLKCTCPLGHPLQYVDDAVLFHVNMKHLLHEASEYVGMIRHALHKDIQTGPLNYNKHSNF